MDIGLADIDKGGEAALDDVKALLGTPLAAFKSRVLDDDAFHVLYREPDDKIGGPAHCYGETRINSGYAAIWDICEWASAVKAAPDAARTDFGPLLAKRAGVGGEAKGRHDTLRDRLIAAQKAGDLTDDLFAKYRAEHVEAVGDDRDGGEEADKLLAWVKANVESKPNPEGMTIETLVAECENDPGRAFKEDALAFAASLSKPDFMRLQGLLKDAKVSPIGDWRKDVARVKDAGDEGPETVEPWSEEVDGAELLDALVAIFKRYASMPDGGPEAAAAWAMFAWCHDAFGVSPIFMASAPERACGKTRVTEILSWMVPRPKPVFAASVAAIVRGIEAWCPSLLFDEAQTIFTSKGESAEYMRQLLTASFNRQFAFVDKCVGDDHEPVSFATFCPRAVNEREIHKLEDMLTSRSIVVIMERAEPGSLERLRAEVDPVGEEIRSKAARWRDDNIDDVRECDPEMPAGCDDRWADIWRPLFAIAEIAGGGWAVRIATAAGALTVGTGAVDTIKVELLRDIRTIFEARGNPDFLTSKEIHKDLFNMEERPWGTFDKGKAMNNKQRAKLLESFKIKSEQKKFEGNKNLRGYYRKAFAEAWRRYLSAGNGPEPGGSGTGSGPATGDSGTGSAAKPNDNNGVA